MRVCLVFRVFTTDVPQGRWFARGFDLPMIHRGMSIKNHTMICVGHFVESVSCDVASGTIIAVLEDVEYGGTMQMVTDSDVLASWSEYHPEAASS